MRRSSPYCQSNTPANAQSPVKIIQCSRGARSGTLEASRSDDMVVTLMFRPPGCGNDDAAFVHPVLQPFRTWCEPKPTVSGGWNLADSSLRCAPYFPSFRDAPSVGNLPT